MMRFGGLVEPAPTEYEGRCMFSRLRRTETPREPTWFVAALAQRPEHFDVEVEGCRIHGRAWGDAHLPPLILLHGGAAHSGWWDHIAPFFSQTHHVIAPDLSGHGDSGHRKKYDLETWAREVLAVVPDHGSTGRPKIIGHSLGGSVTATAARKCGQQIDSILVIDTPLRERAPEEARLRDRKRQPGYRTRNEIIARFRAVPSQRVTLPYITRHIALDSIRRSSTGWIWKFDPAIFGGNWIPETPNEQELLEDMLAEVSCRLGYLHCEAGLVPHDMAEEIRSMQQLRGPFIELAAAGHHPMLDQPLPLVAAIRTLLEFWSIT